MSASQQQMTSGGVGPVSKEQVKVGENALAALRMDTQGALADLALGTGGLLIANGNDVRKGIERAVGDLRGYYEVSYEPSRKDYDGKFRRLEVRVTRPGVTAQTRSGYFAIPPEEGSATFAFEVDLLRVSVTVYRNIGQSAAPGDHRDYRSETIIDVPYVRHRGEPLSLQLSAFLDLVDNGDGGDAEAARAQTLPPHRVAALMENR
jgi:hypothetical protein